MWDDPKACTYIRILQSHIYCRFLQTVPVMSLLTHLFFNISKISLLLCRLYSFQIFLSMNVMENCWWGCFFKYLLFCYKSFTRLCSKTLKNTVFENEKYNCKFISEGKLIHNSIKCYVIHKLDKNTRRG